MLTRPLSNEQACDSKIVTALFDLLAKEPSVSLIDFEPLWDGLEACFTHQHQAAIGIASFLDIADAWFGFFALLFKACFVDTDQADWLLAVATKGSAS